MRGVDLLTLPLDHALDVVAALMVDDAMPVVAVETKRGVELYDRRRVRGEVYAAIASAPDATASTRDARTPPTRTERARAERWDRDTWGLLPEHQASARAAMAFAGGLGGPR